MAHGYLGDGYGAHGDFDPDRGDEHDRGNRERGWRGREESWRSAEQDRMFSGWDRGRFSDERGSRFGDFEGEQRERRRFSANPDDHYRSWRDRHMSELDRDYEDYCREREQQFHSDFDQWRRQRQASPQPLRTGMTQTGLSADPTGMTQAEAETSPATADVEDPMAGATPGTTSRGRGRG